MTQQKCNSPECNLFAEYKAPLSPDNLRQYQWFCLQHIKEYNKNWNYFENMTADEIETFIENDIIGHRKTQKIDQREKRRSTSRRIITESSRKGFG